MGYRSKEKSRTWARNKVLRALGLTEEVVVRLLEFQGGKCAMADCSATTPGGKYGTWYVDHDHATGEVRGLLCNTCNVRLGYYEKDRRRQSFFELYLNNPPYRRTR